ncbi:MAG TPA: hypothetical protein VK674_01460 [Candidatus Limnocylindria bacterium]|nr:hypothetical protein [Candidatus Limnocylindria bacterium]
MRTIFAPQEGAGFDQEAAIHEKLAALNTERVRDLCDPIAPYRHISLALDPTVPNAAEFPVSNASPYQSRAETQAAQLGGVYLGYFRDLEGKVSVYKSRPGAGDEKRDYFLAIRPVTLRGEKRGLKLEAYLDDPFEGPRAKRRQLFKGLMSRALDSL